MPVPASTVAASWEQHGKIDLIKKEIPALKAGQVIIKVAASGLCGTDIHICNGETPMAHEKVTIGHEFSGYVEAVHPDTRTALQVGDLVAVDPNLPCHACTYCRNLKPHLCTDFGAIGVSMDGGMSQYVAVPHEAAYPVPKDVNPVTASLAEPLSCVVHAVDMGRIETGYTVGVIGGGPIGMMTLALASFSGATVDLIELKQARLSFASKKFGIRRAMTPSEAKGLEQCYDVVFECVGRTETMEQAVNLTKPGGTCIWVGVAKPDARCSISPFDVYRRELTIRSTYTNPKTMERAINLLADNKVDWGSLVSHTYKLEDFAEAWKTFRSGEGIKICVTP
ncbi:hypothetical protein BZG36_00325 [Bifiguratus adelaidae]|uniref:Enoyl reductase (ER) domain-containing protein n=1 Tax=Bifiguratus adelaidae TaxID=1938954 RepID=A0A261Y7X0_9FUNG|nr:hypothetical protein BZG36_00325 [Bifiguratus adelaidae]